MVEEWTRLKTALGQCKCKSTKRCWMHSCSTYDHKTRVIPQGLIKLLQNTNNRDWCSVILYMMHLLFTHRQHEKTNMADMKDDDTDTYCKWVVTCIRQCYVQYGNHINSFFASNLEEVMGSWWNLKNIFISHHIFYYKIYCLWTVAHTHIFSLIHTLEPHFGLSVIPQLYPSHLLTTALQSTPHLATRLAGSL